MFFTVFKAPAEGRTHIFRPNEPFAADYCDPEEASFELEKMGEEESAERELQARRITTAGRSLRRGRNGHRRPISCSTAPIATYTVRRRKDPAKAEAIGELKAASIRLDEKGPKARALGPSLFAQTAFISPSCAASIAIVAVMVMMIVVVVVMMPVARH